MNKIHLFISNFEVKNALRLIIKILLFAPILLLVITVNIYYDPAGLYRKIAHKNEKLEHQIAQELLKGKTIRLLQSDIDDRLLQEYIIENMLTAPDVVILGSSHSRWLGGNIFPNSTVINNSVIRAELADYLGIFEEYAKRSFYPKRVVFLLDPQLIGFPFISERWLSIKEDTFGMLNRLGIQSERIKQPVIQQAWLNIFSFSYFQKSIEKLKDSQRIHPMRNDVNHIQLFLKDGRRLWNMEDPQESPPPIRDLNNGINERLLQQMKLDKELKYILENFIRYLIEHHIQVTLCLLPMHPEVYKNFIELQKGQGTLDILGIEHYYQGVAQRLNLKIVGSYDPAVCNLDGKDFYDGDHIKNDAIERMLKQKGSKCSMP